MPGYVVFADGNLDLSEVYQLRTSADLVILSACETNVGRIASGEGVMSLARAFRHAGTSSTISSLWQVNANSTGKILLKFYQNLALGMSKPEALTEAKRSFLSDPSIPSFKKTPYHWAGLIYYGDDTYLDLKPASDISRYLLILGFLVVGMFGMKYILTSRS